MLILNILFWSIICFSNLSSQKNSSVLAHSHTLTSAVPKDAAYEPKTAAYCLTVFVFYLLHQSEFPFSPTVHAACLSILWLPCCNTIFFSIFQCYTCSRFKPHSNPYVIFSQPPLFHQQALEESCVLSISLSKSVSFMLSFPMVASGYSRSPGQRNGIDLFIWIKQKYKQ